MVYEDCIISGPYKSRKDGRLRCRIKFPDGSCLTKSYPKYLMEVHLNRYLGIDETVHHKDGNFLNNNLDNLEVIERREHSYSDAYKNQDKRVTCSYCGKEFTIPGSKLSNRNRKDRKQSGYFCSKSCSGKYGKEIQLGLRNHKKVDKIIPNKYKGMSAPGEISDVDAG